MIKIDLITGFLGAGKTTFIRKYAKYLMDSGKNIGILENDFGAVNVDMMMLQDLMGDQCELEMISGGCDPETHRRRFKTKLISMGMCGYDRILVEPSGIFDVDEFFDILHEEPLDRWYEPGSVITIVDANLEEEMSEEENYILASEAASAGKIVFSKIGKNLKTEKEAQMEEKGSIAKAEESISKVLAHINIALKQIKCERVIEEKDCLCKNWDTLTKADFQDLMSAGYTPENYQKLDFEQDSVFESLYFLNKKISVENMKKAAEELFQNPDCGHIFRIKGFLNTNYKEEVMMENKMEDKMEKVDKPRITKAESWKEFNATRKNISIQPVKEGQEVLSMCDVAERLEKMGMEKGKEEEKIRVYKKLIEKGFSEQEAQEITELPKPLEV